MSFALPDIDPNTSGGVYHVPVPLSRYLSESFDLGQHDTVLNSLSRMSELSSADADPNSPILDPKTANEKYGVGNLKFQNPVRESVAKIMSQRKRDEMDREFFLNQGSSRGRFIPGMAASLLGAVSNPVDLALMFVPFVGEEEAAARATTVLGRTLARRLITRESIDALVPSAPRLTEAVINGVVGQAMFEIPNLAASIQDHADYGPAQAAFNVFAGGAFSAGLHGVARMLEGLTRATRETMANTALNQMLRDEPIRVNQYVSIDENAIRNSMKFNEEMARVRAFKNIKLEDIQKAVADAYGEKVASPAVRNPTSGEIYSAGSHIEGWKKLGFTEEEAKTIISPSNEGFVTDKGRFISRDEAGRLVGLPDAGYNHVMWEDDNFAANASIDEINNGAKSYDYYLGGAEQSRVDQLMRDDPSLSYGAAMKQILKEREPRRLAELLKDPELQRRVKEQQDIEIQKFIDREREKTFEKAKQAEIDRQIAEGKTMPPEEVQDHQHSEDFAAEPNTKIDEEIASLEQDLGVAEKPKENGVQTTALNAEQQGVLDRWIADLDDKIKQLSKPNDKMFTGVTGLEPLIAMVGKEVAKGLLIATREGLKLTNDLVKAIDHAMEWFKNQASKKETMAKMEEESKLAKSEIRQKIAEATTPEEKGKWEKLLNPQQSRRGFMSRLGKMLAATSVDPRSVIPVPKEDAFRAYVPMEEWGMSISREGSWGDYTSLQSAKKLADEGLADFVAEYFIDPEGGFVSPGGVYKEVRMFLKEHGIDIGEYSTGKGEKILRGLNNIGENKVNTIIALLAKYDPTVSKFGVKVIESLDAKSAAAMKEFAQRTSNGIPNSAPDFPLDEILHGFPVEGKDAVPLGKEVAFIKASLPNWIAKIDDAKILTDLQDAFKGKEYVELRQKLKDAATRATDPNKLIRQHLEAAITGEVENRKLAEVMQAPHVDELRTIEPRTESINSAIDCLLTKMI